jgi:hypothetical protein
MIKPYTIIEDQWVKLIDGPFAGIMYKYGKVQLVEETDQLRIVFDYETDTGQQLDKEFNDYIGDILLGMIEEGLQNNSIVYTGGTEEQ